MSDSHLGFSLPSNYQGTKLIMRRRGQNLVNNFIKALKIAQKEHVSFILHTGDLFNSKHPPNELERIVYNEIRKISSEIPFYLVPGNHERSKYLTTLESIPGMHIFSKPKLYFQTIEDMKVTLSGFPYTSFVRDIASTLIKKATSNQTSTHSNILCLHQLIESAKTGNHNFQLNKNNPHVIRLNSIPEEINYVAAGHLHRYQILKPKYLGKKIIYSGSTSRIHYDERNQDKGVIIGRIENDGNISHKFEPLPVKEFPKVDLDISSYFSPSTIQSKIKEELSRLATLSLAEDCFPTLNIVGKIEQAIWRAIDLSSIKRFIPKCSWLVRLKTKNLKIKNQQEDTDEKSSEDTT